MNYGDEWQYHQDGRDDAAGVGCLAILIILLVGAVAVGALSVELGALKSLGAGLALLLLLVGAICV